MVQPFFFISDTQRQMLSSELRRRLEHWRSHWVCGSDVTVDVALYDATKKEHTIGDVTNINGQPIYFTSSFNVPLHVLLGDYAAHCAVDQVGQNICDTSTTELISALFGFPAYKINTASKIPDRYSRPGANIVFVCVTVDSWNVCFVSEISSLLNELPMRNTTVASNRAALTPLTDAVRDAKAEFSVVLDLNEMPLSEVCGLAVGTTLISRKPISERFNLVGNDRKILLSGYLGSNDGHLALQAVS